MDSDGEEESEDGDDDNSGVECEVLNNCVEEATTSWE
jgi:hypothetical protein